MKIPGIDSRLLTDEQLTYRAKLAASAYCEIKLLTKQKLEAKKSSVRPEAKGGDS